MAQYDTASSPRHIGIIVLTFMQCLSPVQFAYMSQLRTLYGLACAEARNSQLQVAVAGFVYEDTTSFDVHVFQQFVLNTFPPHTLVQQAKSQCAVLHNSEVQYIVLSGFDGLRKK